jgi:hypothetical protein
LIGDSSVEESLPQDKSKLLEEASEALKDIVKEFNSFFRDSFSETVQTMRNIFDKEKSTTPQLQHLTKK